MNIAPPAVLPQSTPQHSPLCAPFQLVTPALSESRQTSCCFPRCVSVHALPRSICSLYAFMHVHSFRNMAMLTSLLGGDAFVRDASDRQSVAIPTLCRVQTERFHLLCERKKESCSREAALHSTSTSIEHQQVLQSTLAQWHLCAVIA